MGTLLHPTFTAEIPREDHANRRPGHRLWLRTIRIQERALKSSGSQRLGKRRSKPDQWGSADPWLGVPITWQQISNTKIIIELGHEDFPVDPSFGSHFFQNITSLHIGYLTIDHKNINDSLNFNWLTTLKPKEEKKYIKWFQFDDSFKTIIDGLSGVGKILIPKPSEIELMDEEDSTGI